MQKKNRFEFTINYLFCKLCFHCFCLLITLSKFIFAFKRRRSNQKLLNFIRKKNKPKKKCSSHETEHWIEEMKQKKIEPMNRFSLVKYQHYLFFVFFAVSMMRRENKSAIEQREQALCKFSGD